MEILSETDWDVVLTGTGLQQSLLALALSRSGKKVLHVDRNDYYGGAEAALTLQEAEDWVRRVNECGQLNSPTISATKLTPSAAPPHSLYHDASLDKPGGNVGRAEGHLGSSRAYSLSLSPKIIFTRSNLLPALVSSKVHEQLEFLAVGTWFTFESQQPEEPRNPEPGSEASLCRYDRPAFLCKIPGSREDVFADQAVPLRAKRSLIKLLKLAADPEEHLRIADQHGDLPFSEFLTKEHLIPINLQAPLHALTLSRNPPNRISTSFALRNIHRHVTSIGIFGPGFNAVVPKWGGLSEIAQVGCRTGAVGGAVYVLGKGVESFERINDVSAERSAVEAGRGQKTEKSIWVKLNGKEDIRTRWLIGNSDGLPPSMGTTSDSPGTCYAISIIASPISSLFLPPKEGAPPPAASVVVFPSGSLLVGTRDENLEAPPVYVTVHSADTGECPAGQCIIYAQTQASPQAKTLLKLAVKGLLESTRTPPTSVLLTLTYMRALPPPSQPSPAKPQQGTFATSASTPIANNNPNAGQVSESSPSGIIVLPHLDADSSSSAIALEDSVLHYVRAAWEKITADDDLGSRGSFMVFPERETEKSGDGGEGEGLELDDDDQALDKAEQRVEREEQRLTG